VTAVTVTDVALRCPDLAALEASPLAPGVRDHVAACSSCRLVLDVFEHGPSLDTADCLRFDALLAARGDGTLNAAGKNLLERHLASCETCRAVAETLSPTQDSHGDHAMLPKVDPAGYALGLEVARGGMGRILAARDLRVGRPVAVKELLGRSPHLAARFEREARVTARLQHPGIVPIYEIGRWPDGTPFYSMRMVDGRTLRAAIDRATTPAARLALLPAVIAACEAVAFAHSQRVIHRDLTPSNILVGAYGETVVIDWGLAKDLSQGTPDEPFADPYRADASSEGLTGVGAVVGTPGYMPPEQARASQVDERADVYALGAILYHVLAGVAPFKSRGIEDLLHELAAGPPPPIERVAPSTPRDLVSIVTKAMARAPEARYPSARELADELKRFQTGRMVEAHTYSRGELMRRFVRRHRGAVTATTLALLVLTSTVTIAVSRIIRSREAANVTARELLLEKGRVELLGGNTLRSLAYLHEAYQRGSRGPALQFLLGAALSEIASLERTLDCGGDVRQVAFSPDGQQMTSACHDVAKIWQLADGKLLHTLGPFPAGFDNVEYSHAGATLVTFGGDGIARVWDARTGASRAELRHGALITFATFTPDDARIATSGDDGFARIWDVGAKRQLRAIQASNSLLLKKLFGVLSPDGKHLLTMTFEGKGKGFDVETGALLGGFDHGSLVSGGVMSPDGKHAVTCDLDGTAKVWDANTGALQATLTGHTDIVWKCIFSPDSSRVLTGSHDGTAKLWDLATHRELITVQHGDIVWTLAFSPDGRRFATTSFGGGVKVWDAASGVLLTSHESFRDKEARFSPDGRDLIVARGDERIQIWRLPMTFGPPQGANVVAVSPDGAVIATAAGMDQVTLWNARGARIASEEIALPIAISTTRIAAMTPRGIAILDSAGATLRTLAIPIPRTLAISADGSRLITMTSGAPEIWDTASGEQVARLDGATDALPSEDGRRAIAWSAGSAPAVWDLGRPTRITKLGEVGQPIGFARSRVALIDSTKRGVSLWNADTGALVMETGAAQTATFDPTGDWMTTIDSDHVVTIRSTSDGNVRSSFLGEQLLQAQASADGSLVAAIGDYGRAVMIMSALDGRILARHSIEHAAPVVTQTGFEPPRGTVWWTPNGKAVVSLSRGVALWNTDNPYTPDAVAKLVEKYVPWRVVDGRLELIHDGRLAGVVTRAGKPVARATVRIEIRTPADLGTAPINWESMKARASTREQLTDDDGRFAIDQLVPGEYAVSIDGSKYSVHVGVDDEPFAVDLAHAQ